MRPTFPVSRLLVVLLAVSLAVAGPALGAVAAGPAVVSGGVHLQAGQPTPTNDTVQHEDPREVDADGDLGALRRWLAGRMAVRLEDCVVDVGAGEADVCEFGDDYPAWLGLYVDVADETADPADDRRSEAFGAAAGEAADYAANVSAFRETYTAYQAARAAGNETRARAHGRELMNRAAAVEATGTDLQEQLAVVAGADGVDLADARAAMNATIANVTAIADRVATEQFVRTTLTADLDPRTISFRAPGTISGRLVTENGSAVADREVRLRVGSQVVATRTDGDGRFAVTYRPIRLQADAEAVTVRYEPAPRSVFLASNATVPVAVEAVEPTVEVGTGARTVRFGDEVTITGSVAANDVGAPDVPVVVTLDGRRLGVVTTDPRGGFATTATVAARDGPDSVDLRARLALEGRALAATEGVTTVTVATSATTLTADASASGPDGIGVRGRLTTDDGTAVPAQSVVIEVGGVVVETVRTGPDGRYDATVSLPSSVTTGGTDDPVEVVAVFEGTGTNLERSTARQSVVLPIAEPGTDGGFIDRVLAPVLEPVPGTSRPGLAASAVIAIVAVLAALMGLLLIRRRAPWGAPSNDTSGPADDAGAATDEAPAASPLEPARTRLEADADGAVMLAYGAVRTALTRRTAAQRGRADTHWEFLAACRQDGLDEASIDQLTALTEAYERAAYAPVSVARADAEAALATAETLV